MPILTSHLCCFFFLLLLLFVDRIAGTAVPGTGTRRSLHQPFFPAGSGNPSPPPATPITSNPSSSGGGGGSEFFPPNPIPTATNNRPPAAIPSVTIPVNLSGLAWPTVARDGSDDAKKAIVGVVISLVALAALLTVIILFRRRSSGEFSLKATRSSSIRLFSAGGPGSVASKDGTANGSDFLYLGTLVDSHRPHGEDSPVVSLHNQKASSPESFHQRSPDLHPLPPLSRQCWPSEDEGQSTDDGDNESFYSPRASSSGKHHESPDVGADSRRVFFMHSTTRPDVGGSIATMPSYPSSLSTSPVASKAPSPELDTESSISDGPTHDSFRLPLSSSPRTLEKRHILPSTPSSPSTSTASDKSTVSENQSFSGQLAPPKQTVFPMKLPPPPPPPPPKGSLSRFSVPPLPPSRPIFRPPTLVAPKRNSQSLRSESSPEAKSQGKPTSPRNNEQPAENSVDNPRPKLKPLHWDKVWASSDRVMVWDQLKFSSFQLNEEMIETLFVCNPTNAAPKEPNRRVVLTPPVQENRVLDPKKSQNLAILLRALNVTKEEVCNALSEGNTDGLGAELLETLLKMAPTKEEELKLKGHTEDGNSKLGTAERFLKAVLDIPFAFKRADAMLYIANFESEISYLRKSFQTLEAACEELKSSRLFLKLLEAVLKTGNRMNVGTNRGDAQAFKLDTLLKLVDVKGTDGKTTLLHFVVQEIIRSEEAHLANLRAPSTDLPAAGNPRKVGLQVVAALSGELSNVKKAASMDSDVLASSVRKLAAGLEKVSDALRLSGDDEGNAQFASSMSSFKTNAEEEIVRIRTEENAALSHVKEITEYFHGNAAREEAHPFRIFVIVSDFLDVLDRVCKQVGRMQLQTAVPGGGRQLPVPTNPILPPAARVFRRRWTDSDDDSGSSSS
ncbi:unnamed protein product [Victoria cruziana]